MKIKIKSQNSLDKRYSFSMGFILYAKIRLWQIKEAKLRRNKLANFSARQYNHGGQNSVIDGLIYGVPQLICAGKVFERKYNAGSIAKIGAGLEIPYKAFNGRNIKAVADKIISENKYRENALKTGNILLSQGGTENIINLLES